MDDIMDEDTPLIGHREDSRGSTAITTARLLMGGWIFGAATAIIAIRAFDVKVGRTQSSTNIPLLQKSEKEDDGGSHSSYEAPAPSEQDWCMAQGSYDFFGTYRSPHNRAEEGLFYAPGRFQGIILTGQNDESVYFHLVNLTYGNDDSPHHIPTDSQEYDMFDTYCTMHPVKKSACYSPKFLPKPDMKHKTRCAKLEFPSMNGFALCRQLAMADFAHSGTVTLAPNTHVEEWTARLDTEGDPPNEYDGQLKLYMQTVEGSDGKLKIPLTHWLTSDDQSLEASFQVTNWKAWDDAESYMPDVPPGCERAIDVTKLHNLGQKDMLLFARDGRMACPAGAMHRNIIQPQFYYHYLSQTLS